MLAGGCSGGRSDKRVTRSRLPARHAALVGPEALSCHTVRVSVEKFRAAVAVYGVLRDGDRVLLIRRAGSGYHDGELGLPAGHVDGGEDVRSALIRELVEELEIEVSPDACRLSAVAHRAPESPTDHEYIDLFFTVDRWTGTPSIGEPGKCSELIWAEIDDLPSDTIDYVRRAILACGTDDTLVLDGWPVATTSR